MEVRKRSVRIARLGVIVTFAMLGYGIDLAAVPAAPWNLWRLSVLGTLSPCRGRRREGKCWDTGSKRAPRPARKTWPTHSSARRHSCRHGRAAGIYYVRVRAVAADGEGPASNEIAVTVGGTGPCAGPPGAPTGLEASVTGTTVTFSWAPGGGCPASNFAVHAGSGPGMSNIAVGRHGHGPEPHHGSAARGTYYVRVLAQNAFGSSQPSNQQVVTVGGVSGGGGGNVHDEAPLGGTVTTFG